MRMLIGPYSKGTSIFRHDNFIGITRPVRTCWFIMLITVCEGQRSTWIPQVNASREHYEVRAVFSILGNKFISKRNKA
jgi:hypothetical protein